MRAASGYAKPSDLEEGNHGSIGPDPSPPAKGEKFRPALTGVCPSPKVYFYLRYDEHIGEKTIMGTQSGSGTERKRRYWAVRTDRDNRALLLDELRKGRLRQGWGWDPSQDLRLIQAEIVKGGPWWERLSATQKHVLPHLRMLADAADSVRLGDWIVVPKLPEDGTFLVAEVAGHYYYEPLKLSGETDANDLGQDYGHVLPVRLRTPKAINRYADEVTAGLRGSLKAQMRMWCLDGYAETLERLVDLSQRGADLSSATSGKARLDNAWKVAWTRAKQTLREHLGPELDARFVGGTHQICPGGPLPWC